MAAPAAILSIYVNAQTGPAVKGLMRVNTQLAATQSASNKAVGAIKTVGKVAAIGAAGGLAFAVKKAADFEQQMDSLGAVTDATGREMEKFRKQAMKAGADTKFSALDAAAAQTELAKGGLSVSRIMKGGLRSALALAAAGEMDLADAAGTTANAIKLFGLRGKDSVKVADALATAANRTTADVKDFALALRMGGSVAKLAGLSFNDTVVALEALAEAGIKGSDAGTSLKAFFLNIATPSKRAKAAMDELGVSLFDAQGKLKSLPGIAANLRGAFGDLTKEQFLNKAGVIAGSDAIRTLYSLYSAGPDKLGRLAAATAKHGTAADVAAKKQDNLKGKLENLQGSIETIAISIGSKLLPVLTDYAEQVTKILNDPKMTPSEKFSKLAEMVADAFSKAIPKIAEAAAKAAPVVAGAFIRGFLAASIWGKLAIGTFLLARFGGKGAFLAIGKKIGAFLGIGVATGMAGGAAGAGAAAGAGGGMLGGILGKLKGPAARVGMVGAGLYLADTLFSAFDARAKRRSAEALEAIDALADAGSILRGIPGIGSATEGISFLQHKDVDTAKQLQASLHSLASGAKVSADRARQLIQQINGLDDASAQGKNAMRSMVEQGIRPWERGMARLANRLAGDWRGINQVSKQNLSQIAQYMTRFPEKGAEAVRQNMRLTKNAILDSMKAGSTSANQGMRAIRQAFVTHSQASKETTKRNFDLAADAIRSAVKSGEISAKRGAAEIARLFKAYLGQFGITGRAAEIYLQTKPGQGKPQNYQRGGGIDVPGSGSGDKVALRAMVEPGEKVFVLNRNASDKLRQLDGLNRAVPRFQGGGYITRGVLGGPDSSLKAGAQTGLDRTRDAANEKLLAAAEKFAAASSGVPTGDAKGSLAVAIAQARRMGLSVTSFLRPGDTGSLHSEGRAVDLSNGSGPTAEMAAFYRWALKHFRYIEELFYDPIGGIDKNVSIGAIGGHSDHVHIAFKKGGLLDQLQGGGTARASGNSQWSRAARALRTAGFRGKQLQLALAVGGAESGSYSDMTGDAGLGGSYGPWMVHHPSHPQYDIGRLQNDWTYAAKAAYAISGGGRNWSPWTMYRNGGYRSYMDEATSALLATRQGTSGGGGSKPTPGQDNKNVGPYSPPKYKPRKLSKKMRKQLKQLQRTVLESGNVPSHGTMRKVLEVVSDAERPKDVRQAVGVLTDQIKGIGLGRDLGGKVDQLTKDSTLFGDFADRAGQLTQEVEDGDPILGKVSGLTEVDWLKKQLDTLFSLRNALIQAHDTMVKRREEITELIEVARTRLRKVGEKIQEAARRRRQLQERFQQLARHPKKNAQAIDRVKKEIRELDENQGARERIRDALKGKIIPTLTGKRGELNTSRGDILSSLEQVQGPGSPMEALGSLPEVGVLGGEIFNVQTRLRDLTAQAAKVTDTSAGETGETGTETGQSEAERESAELLRQLLDESNLRYQVSQKQYEVFRNMPPYGGQFATGGMVPGALGEARTVVAHGGEVIFPVRLVRTMTEGFEQFAESTEVTDLAADKIGDAAKKIALAAEALANLAAKSTSGGGGMGGGESFGESSGGATGGVAPDGSAQWMYDKNLADQAAYYSTYRPEEGYRGGNQWVHTQGFDNKYLDLAKHAAAPEWQQWGYVSNDAFVDALKKAYGGYAKGGVVPGPVGRAMPAVVHGGEAYAGMKGEGIKVVVNGDIVGTPRGKDPVEVMLGDRRFQAAVEGATRRQARIGQRVLPGRAGGG